MNQEKTLEELWEATPAEKRMQLSDAEKQALLTALKAKEAAMNATEVQASETVAVTH